ncbi:MAG: type I-E CRISPR-associated protein Cse1/CasA [Proteobacteria bacterium]|nr:type I-E CRISPR-associated protein Cse1/CasA [Pseudomonadota bacterium]
MKFNLIDEKWIPVKRKDGTSNRIRPWEVTEDFENNPVVTLNAPRPDFNGALIQFLIGLVQTTFAPAKRIEWKQKLKTAPSTDQLKTAFMTVHDAFELGGDGPRFMQDFDNIDQKPKPIDWLLIGAATENTIRENRDLFIKREAVTGMCPACCVTTLFTMQTNAPMGGPGFRTSLRGGGPLTTLIIGDKVFDTLWHSIWFNVLESKKFLSMCSSARSSDSNKFPWLAVTKASVTEQDMHPFQYFWAMPRRIKLDIKNLETGICNICTQQSNFLITSYREVNKGAEYKAPMKHPLSPFNGNTQKSVLTQPGGVSYRHWLGFVVNDNEGKREPARIVHEFINERQQSDWQLRCWAFGYDTENMKARCWYDAKMPLITVSDELIAKYEDTIASLIKASIIICGNIKIAIKRVLHGIPEYDSITRQIKWKYKDIKRLHADEEKARIRILNSTSDVSLFMAVEAFFWQKTEQRFYSTLNNIMRAAKNDEPHLIFLEGWHHALCSEALQQFDAHMLNGPIEDVDIKKVSLARKELNDFNKGTFVRTLLGL